jgi:hypothetical protein
LSYKPISTADLVQLGWIGCADTSKGQARKYFSFLAFAYNTRPKYQKRHVIQEVFRIDIM